MRRRRDRPRSQVSPERWLLSYADFITLLFAFFVVLFAATQQNNQALQRLAGAIHSGFSSLGAVPGPATPAPHQPPADLGFAALNGQLHQALAPSITRGEVAIAQTPDGLVISLREMGFFNSGEAALLPGAAAKIDEIGGLLMQRGLAVRVEGHSDDQPIHNAMFQSNWELSAARAMTVLLLLVDTAHYDPTRISMAGYGPYRPAAANTTAAGRRLNRRVDLVVLPRQ